MLAYKTMCQLEGCDRGGRDSAAELALAGGIDVNVGRLLQWLTWGQPRHDVENYTPLKLAVNDFVDERCDTAHKQAGRPQSTLFTEDLTLFRALPILQSPQSPMAR